MQKVESAGLNKRHMLTKPVTMILCFSIIASSALSFIYNGLIRGLNTTPTDFYYFYVAGQLWNSGSDIYDPELFVARLSQLGSRAVAGFGATAYPPQGYMFFSILAPWPVEVAHWVFVGINLLLLVIALGMFALVLARYRPIGLLEIALLASFLNTGFARGNIRDCQVSLVVCVALFGTFLLATRQRAIGAGLVLSIVSFKPSFFPYYAGYYLLRRSYRLIIVCALSVVALTSLPLFLTHRPFLESMAAWLQSLTLLQSQNTINDPSPMTPYSAEMVHLMPLLLRVLNVQSNITVALSWLIVLILSAYTAYLIYRSEPSAKVDLLDFGLVSALSLLGIYHRYYDIFLLFPGLLYLYLHTLRINEETTQRNWAVFLVVIILLISMPGDVTIQLSNAYPVLLTSYLWRVIAPFQAWAGVAIFGALLWLKAHQARRHESKTAESEGATT